MLRFTECLLECLFGVHLKVQQNQLTTGLVLSVIYRYNQLIKPDLATSNTYLTCKSLLLGYLKVILKVDFIIKTRF